MAFPNTSHLPLILSSHSCKHSALLGLLYGQLGMASDAVGFRSPNDFLIRIGKPIAVVTITLRIENMIVSFLQRVIWALSSTGTLYDAVPTRDKQPPYMESCQDVTHESIHPENCRCLAIVWSLQTDHCTPIGSETYSSLLAFSPG